ncbi:hypothetical protein Leryth_015554 [Lithospermum erythrorhizon]|nr:hypothetical protein Leryth_015554 [Lithospermum erythrorhizon]
MAIIKNQKKKRFHFQSEQYTLRAHLHSRRSTHSLMKLQILMDCNWISLNLENWSLTSSTQFVPFMRVNPILDWSSEDVWAFLLTSKVPYCSLYDQGYTSIGSIHDTVPNALLSTTGSSKSEEKFRPAYLLQDGRLERAGRVKKKYPASDGGPSLLPVFIYGGVGPLQSDVTVAGVAKAFGVRLMAQLPEGITELLHHDQLPMPLDKKRLEAVSAALYNRFQPGKFSEVD